MSQRDLTPLFAPKAVALVGATDDPRKWGHFYARSLLRGESDRSVYLVNARGASVFGRQTLTSLTELPESPDLVVSVVPARAFGDVVDQAIGVNARAVVAITAGLGEAGEEGRSQERAIVERVRGAGAVLVGPNCLGLIDTRSGLDAAGFIDLPPGEVAFFSQSGTLGCDLAMRAYEAGYGFSRFVSVGNQADITAAELIDDAIAHEHTSVIALYIEDVVAGRRLVESARRARDAGKPVVLLAAGLSTAGARSAQSHTGSLAADAAVMEAACRAAGIYLVRSPGELSDLLAALAAGKRASGRRTAIVSEGGGACTIAADLATSTGLAVGSFSAALQDELRDVLPEHVSPSNPLDLAGDQREALHRSAAVLAGSDEVDAVLLVGLLGYYSTDGVKGAPSDAEAEAADEIEAADRLVELAAATSKPVLVSTVAPGSRAGERLRRGGVYVHREFEQPLRLIERLAQHAGAVDAYEELPPPSPAVDVDGVGYWQARDLLAEGDIPVTDARPVRTADEARAAAAAIGYPVVLKVATVLHKTDVGGVALDIADEAALLRAFEEMHERFGDTVYSVEECVRVDEGVELIAGCKQDPRFGPVLVIGIGGVFVEVLEDAAVALAPVSVEQARAMITGLKGAPMLTGARGRGALDVDAAARVAASLSAVAARHPELAAFEVNPLLVRPDGALALDARIVAAGPDPNHDPGNADADS